jgi:hypothetical protein
LGCLEKHVLRPQSRPFQLENGPGSSQSLCDEACLLNFLNGGGNSNRDIGNPFIILEIFVFLTALMIQFLFE